MTWLEALELLDSNLVISDDLQLYASFRKLLENVVGKRVVVIENKNHVAARRNSAGEDRYQNRRIVPKIQIGQTADRAG